MNELYTFAGLLLVLLGFVCCYAWFALYLDDKGKVQSTLQGFLANCWLWSASLQDRTLSQESRFVRRIMEITSHGLDVLLGKPLFSVRSISVSICFSVATVGTTILVASTLRLSGTQYQWIIPSGIGSVLFFFFAFSRIQWLRIAMSLFVITVAGLFFAAVLLAPESDVVRLANPDIGKRFASILLNDSNRQETIETIRHATDVELLANGLTQTEVDQIRALPNEQLYELLEFTNEDRDDLAPILGDIFAKVVADHPEYQSFGLTGRTLIGLVIGGPIVLAILSDVVVICLTRVFLRRGSASKSVSNVVAFGLCNVGLASLFFLAPLYIAVLVRGALPLHFALVLFAFMNWSVVLVSLSWFFLGAGLLANRMIWPHAIGYFDSMSTAQKSTLRAHCMALAGVALGTGFELLGIHWFSSWL